MGQNVLLPSDSKPNKYEDFIGNYIDQKKFISGMDLNSTLATEFGVTSDYARKIIQRAVVGGVITSTSPLTFGKKQYVYLQPGEHLNLSRLREIAEKYRPPVFRLLEAMDLNGGIISIYEGLKVTASPLKPSSTKVDSLNDIIADLKHQGVIKERSDGNGINYLLYDKKTINKEEEERLMASHRTNMVTDCIFLPDTISWLTRSNIIDNHKVIYRNKNAPSIGAIQNNLIWDAYGYTKTTGLNPGLAAKAATAEKMTMVAVDVVIARPYSLIDLDGFLNRLQINLNSVSGGTRKVIPIVVYREISEHALNKARMLGFILLDLASVFGANIYTVIERLNLISVDDLKLKGDDLVASVESTLDLIRTSGHEDTLRDIRGVLFEYLLHPLIKALYGNASIEQGKVLTMIQPDDTKEYYEYDFIVKSVTPKEILVIELKGYSAASTINLGDRNTKNTLSWFFRRTLPFAAKALQKEVNESGKVIKGCFITSASFYEDGRKFLETMNKSKQKPERLDAYYDGKALIELLKKNDLTKIIETIEKFYMKSGQD